MIQCDLVNSINSTELFILNSLSSVQSAMDWILQNPDYVHTNDDNDKSEKDGSVIGGDQEIPVEPAIEKTPEEKAAAAASTPNKH